MGDLRGIAFIQYGTSYHTCPWMMSPQPSVGAVFSTTKQDCCHPPCCFLLFFFFFSCRAGRGDISGAPQRRREAVERAQAGGGKNKHRLGQARARRRQLDRGADASCVLFLFHRVLFRFKSEE